MADEQTKKIEKIDWQVFSWPKILFTEVNVANNATAFVQSDQLKSGRDMLIDWVAVSEETYSLNAGAANATYMDNVDVNFWIHDRARFFPQGPTNVQALNNMFDVDRTVNPVAALAIGRGQYKFRHPIRWQYGVQQSVNVEWLNPATLGAATGALNSVMGMHGVGAMTGARRMFLLPWTWATNAAGVAQGIASNTQLMGNPGDQPYLVETSIWAATGAQWAVLNDSRISNHVRFRVCPTGADAWSDLPVPAIFYGPHACQPYRVAWYAPVGGPILLRKGQQMVFEVFNNGAGFNLNVQVALIGRTAPGYTSVV